MSLINCPECKREISDKAKCCPNCGYELRKKEDIYQGIYCPRCLESRPKLHEYEKCWLCKVKMIDSTQGTFLETFHYGDNHPELKNSPDFDEKAYQRRINWVPVEYGTAKLNNAMKCPSCGSTNISKIGAINRMVSVGIFGLASGKIGKTYQCKKCGTTW